MKVVYENDFLEDFQSANAKGGGIDEEEIEKNGIRTSKDKKKDSANSESDQLLNSNLTTPEVIF